jgi:colanic acid/amylovoran biosynthesis protein
MAIEIYGTGTDNRGAELMAATIATQMRGRVPGIDLVVPLPRWSFEGRCRYQLKAFKDFPGPVRGRFASLSTQGFSNWLQEALGLVPLNHLKGILDASGFSYSDQWPGSAGHALRFLNHPARRSAPYIMLPQALGPFNDPKVAEECRQLFDKATRIYPRDDCSYEAAAELCDASKLFKAPDFTISSPAIAPQEDLNLPEAFAVIIPNYRMIDKGDDREGYPRFLRNSVYHLSKQEIEPVFLLHDAVEDAKVIQALQLEKPPLVLRHDDPRVLKWIIGQAQACIGSRFHGLVAALSQGVPSIAAGWAHKYEKLLEDFGVGDLLVKDLEDQDQLWQKVQTVTAPDKAAEIRRGLLSRAAEFKRRNEEMWEEILQLLQLEQ